MKTFTLKLGDASLKTITAELKQASKTGIPNVVDDEMICGSVSAMMDAVSRSRLEAFAAIIKYKPKSLNDLAEHLQKNLGNVSRDVRGLELLGLIELKKDNKYDSKIIRPIAKYDEITFVFKDSKAKGAS